MSSGTITADGLREDIEYWVMKSGGQNRQIVHLPAPNSTLTDPQPVCEDRKFSSGRLREWTGWETKSPAVYPSGYVSLCKNCSSALKRDSSLLELDTD